MFETTELNLIMYKHTSLSSNNHNHTKSHLQHVHPLNWWVGMKDPSLQIMLHGENIADCEVSLVQAEGIRIESIERVHNPNYLFLYLDLSVAPAQTFGIALTKPGEIRPLLTFPYTLYNRGAERPFPIDASDVIYLIMPDRFIDGDENLDDMPEMKEAKVDKSKPYSRHGGDLKGIQNALDYIQELGVTAIWTTPVLVNDMPKASYHGYAITDYYQIDPRFGTNEQFRNLVRDCHSRGLKMVMDLVFNHCGKENFLYRDLPASDWFNFGSEFEQTGYRTSSVNDIHASKFDYEHTTDGWFVASMPDFNQRNHLVKDYLVQVSLWWIEYAHIDAIRQDTYPYADKDMMREWCLRLDSEYPGYNVIGETWINNNVGVSYWQKDSRLAAPFNSQLLTVMDFPLMTLVNMALDEETDEWINGLARIYEYISQDCVYADPLHLLVFFDNHDTDRLYKDEAHLALGYRYFQALVLILTLRGIPQLYYGDEIGMFGNKSNGDGPNRKDFPIEALTKKGRSKLQNRLFNYTKNLLNWRKGCKAVQYGTLTHFAVRSGCYVYSRSYEGKIVTIIMNGTNKTKTLELTPFAEVSPYSYARDVLTGKNIPICQTLKLSPRKTLVLEM